MDSAMRPWRFSRRAASAAGFRGSERTAARRSRPLAVALLSGARQRRSGLGLKGAGKVSAGPSPEGVRPVTARLSSRPGPDRGGCRACLLWLGSRPSGRLFYQCGGLLAVLGDGCRSLGRVISYHALGMLAIIWVHPTRLETRTKESNMCASLRVGQTPRRNESEGGPGR